MQAIIANTIANVQGNRTDIYTFLSMSPWNKFERPIPSEEEILRQLGIKNK